MAALTPKRSTTAGTTLSPLDSAAGGGDYWVNTGVEFFYIRNGDSNPTTVTFDSPNACSAGVQHANHDLAVVVAAGAEKTIGPFPIARFNDGDNHIHVTYTNVTSVKVAVLIPA